MIKTVLISLVAFLHFYFLVLEMFLWTKPLGLKTFRMTIEDAELKKVLAANQGLYNGFLSAGLVWSLMTFNEAFKFQLSVFFLSCVIIAGLYGAYSVSKRIFFIQSLPAILALLSVLVS